MPAGVQACRVAIAGAASLRGKELKQLLEEGTFPATDIRLLDEDVAAGTLTEAGGEPAVIQAVEEDSFEQVRFVFFAGTPAFAARHWETAVRAGATVIDLSGGTGDLPSAVARIPALDGLLTSPQTAAGSRLFISPSTPAIVACSLAAALATYGTRRLAIVFLQPVSERGQAGIEELESQTIQLLSFQPIDQTVFGTQIAFNLLDRYGEKSAERLSDARSSIAREIRNYLEGRAPLPAIQLLQAPVFYSNAFAAYAELDAPVDPAELRSRLESASIKALRPSDPAPSNLTVAGESQVVLGQMQCDLNVEHGYWFWGAADNLRLPAANAIAIAERVLAA